MIVAFLSLPKFLSTDGMLVRLACVQRIWCVIKTDFFRDRAGNPKPGDTLGDDKKVYNNNIQRTIPSKESPRTIDLESY